MCGGGRGGEEFFGGGDGDARRCALLVRLRRWQRRWSGGTRGEWGHLARGEPGSAPRSERHGELGRGIFPS